MHRHSGFPSSNGAPPRLCRVAAIAIILTICAFANSGEARSKTIAVELLNRQQLCVICHAVLDRWKGQLGADKHKFKEDLLTSCSLLDNSDEAKKCRQRVTDAKLEQLGNGAAEELCVAQGLCASGEFAKLSKELADEESRIGQKRRMEEQRRHLKEIPQVILKPPKKQSAKGNTTEG